ncbi:MAG: glycolate oxidase subunit GlcD [Candidatus Methanomethylicota archaeon]|uniref:Glycolate oxidase subunit GlcD n=1 Tax=Thermoproteota archaeon TaxID=2056631 RepID=A0A497ER35_9CREN|nr:MAG: glycolate oxidase subunit GlcD [Candidatus Verstraetearchaeota archaeon]
MWRRFSAFILFRKGKIHCFSAFKPGLNLDQHELASKLVELLGEDKVLAQEEDLYVYGFDATQTFRGKPWAVIRPTCTEDVVKVLAFADQHVIPVVPRGGGSSLTGAVVPIRGGIVLDMTAMRSIRVDVENGVVEAEAGATIDQIDKECRKYGFFFPPDPASSEVATLGGALAGNSGGMRGARYGTMRNWVLAIEVVLPGGKALWLGSPTYKWRGTYDLMGLFVGSEGTLGVITRAVLKIAPLPERIARILALFNDVEAAAKAIYEVRRRGLNPLILEFLDRDSILMVDETYKLGLPKAEAAVLVDVDGPSEAIDRLARQVVELMKEAGAFKVDLATDQEAMDKLYTARREAYSSVTRKYPVVIIEDIVVPLSKLADAVRMLEEVKKKYGLTIITFGHAGDGNLHPNICIDPSNKEEVDKAEKAFYEIAKIALKLGGAVSAEHGIGLQKVELLKMELEHRKSLEAMEYMKAIKRIFDPKGIMNPGKFGL